MSHVDWPIKGFPSPLCSAGRPRQVTRLGWVALNSLLRACLSLKLTLSCRALKQLECMDTLSVSLWCNWMFILLIRNQEESHLRELIDKSWSSFFTMFALYLSQVKLCCLELPAGAVFVIRKNIKVQKSEAYIQLSLQTKLGQSRIY